MLNVKVSLVAGLAGLLLVLVSVTVASADALTITDGEISSTAPQIVTISGTYECPAGEQGNLFIEVHQKKGNRDITGGNFSQVACDGTPQEFSVDVNSQGASFWAKGWATVEAQLTSCLQVSPFTCETTYAGESLRLH